MLDQLAVSEIAGRWCMATATPSSPPEQSRAVADAAPAPAPALRQLLAVKGADHNDPVLLHGNQLIDAVVALADHADQTR